MLDKRALRHLQVALADDEIGEKVFEDINTNSERRTEIRELLVEAFSEIAELQDSFFKGLVADEAEMLAIADATKGDYVARADDQHLWRYDGEAWYSTGEESRVANNYSIKIPFNASQTVQISYASFAYRPSVEIWVLENGVHSLSTAPIVYDEIVKTFTISFGDNFVTGYLILN